MIKIDFSNDNILTLSGSSAELKADLTVVVCAIAQRLGISKQRLLETIKKGIESNPQIVKDLVKRIEG